MNTENALARRRANPHYNPFDAENPGRDLAGCISMICGDIREAREHANNEPWGLISSGAALMAVYEEIYGRTSAWEGISDAFGGQIKISIDREKEKRRLAA